MAFRVRPHQATCLDVDCETMRPAKLPDNESFTISAISVGTIYTWLVAPIRPENPPAICSVIELLASCSQQCHMLIDRDATANESPNKSIPFLGVYRY